MKFEFIKNADSRNLSWDDIKNVPGVYRSIDGSGDDHVVISRQYEEDGEASLVFQFNSLDNSFGPAVVREKSYGWTIFKYQQIHGTLTFTF